MVVYVTTQGTKIVKEGRHLLVKKDGATHHTFYLQITAINLMRSH